VNTDKSELQSSQVANTQVTLDPIRASGPSALDTQGHPDIKSMKLSTLTLSWETQPYQEITIKGEHLLESPRPQTQIPPTAKLARATFLFTFPESDHFHSVFIQPPSTITLQFPADAPRLFPWLGHKGYLITQQLAHAILIAALTLSIAAGQALGDGDRDDDDPASDRKILLN
jgi:hypothetical protein